MNIKIQRTLYRDGETLGLFTAESDHREKIEGFTVELPWKNNKPYISCIPSGVYKAFRRASERNGNVIELNDVPGRTFIQIHIGNTADDLSGCIAVGYERWANGVGRSGEAIGDLWLMAHLAEKNNDTIYVEVKDMFLPERRGDEIGREKIDPVELMPWGPIRPVEWVEPVQYDEKLSQFVRKLSERAKWHRIARISFNASLSIFSRWIPELSHLKIPVDPDNQIKNEVPKMKWIQERLKEGSTWRGIAILIAAFIISRFGLDVSPEVLLSSLEGIVTAGALLVASVAGLWDILKPEKPETPGAAPE